MSNNGNNGIDKVVDYDALKPLFHDGMTLMIGGFLGCGAPESLITFILENGWKNLTIIINDTSFPEMGGGRLVAASEDVIKKVYCCHIGTNKISKQRYNAGTLDIEFIPQGNLIEAIRATACGLGGVITPTGVGTESAKNRQHITIQGKEYIIQEPLKAEVAIINGYKVDHFGNTVYHGTARNFNPMMAMAGDVTICEAKTIVETGTIPPEDVITPGVFIDYIVKSKMEAN
ncbi:MAG: CoA transferase subunit A [Promethearchaeota archaeon]